MRRQQQWISCVNANMKHITFATLLSMATFAAPAWALDAIQSEYCASPKKEILKTLRTAAMLCKTNVTKLEENKYEVTASCKLGIASGSNRTVITIIDDANYSAFVDTVGTKFGEKLRRSEKILAMREGDCKDQQ
jgi:hypothetical protein